MRGVVSLVAAGFGLCLAALAFASAVADFARVGDTESGEKQDGEES